MTVWQKAIELARETYGLAPGLPREETYGMRSQLMLPRGRDIARARRPLRKAAAQSGAGLWE